MKGEITMSYNSKKNIASMIAGVLLIAAYIIYASGGAAPAPDDLKAWALVMLAFIGIGIALTIVIMILFHIAFAIGIAAKECKQGREPDDNIERVIKSSMLEDERDKLIELKTDRVEYVFAGLGFMGMLIALARGASTVTALHIMLGAVCFGMLVGGGVGIYYHERGV